MAGPIPEVAHLFTGQLSGDPYTDCRPALVQAAGRELTEAAGLPVPPEGFWDCYTGEWLVQDAVTGEVVRVPRPGSGSWVPVLLAVGGLGTVWWWWKRKKR